MALNTLFLVLAGSCVAFAAFVEECPPRKSTTCSCKNSKYGVYLRCSEIGSQKALQGTITALRGYLIKSLFLSHVEASAVPSDLFQGMHVKNLYLSDFEVDDASFLSEPHNFVGLNNSLEVLVISSSFKKTGPLSKLKLDHLHSLKVVSLSKSQIPEIGNDWFINGPKDLKSLSASDNGIEKLGDRAFASLKNLRYLAFQNNHLSEISRSMLPFPADSLLSLYFGRNKIRTLPSDIFSGMPSLEYVSLSFNLVHSLPEDTWSSTLLKLKYLGFHGNPLRCDQELKWMCDQKTPAIDVKCASPVDKEGLSMDEFCRS